MPEVVIPKTNPDVPLARVFHGPLGDLHENHIEVPDGMSHPALDVARGALRYAYETVETVDAFRGNQSDEIRSAAHDRLVRERATEARTTFVSKLTNADNELGRALTTVEAKLAADAGLKPNPTHFDAITSAFHQMKPDQRVTTLNQLIEQGEHAALATLIEAPLFLTGLTTEQRDTIKERVYAKVDPQGLKLRDTLAKALKKVDAIGNTSIGVFDQLLAGTHEGAAKERADKAAAHNFAINFGR
jgi:hypothetical protein